MANGTTPILHTSNVTDWKQLTTRILSSPVTHQKATHGIPEDLLLSTAATSQPVIAYTSEAHAIAIATLFIIIGSFGMCGNSLVLVAVALSKKLQTATNAFVVNLSIADFLTCFCLPFHAIGILNKDGWPLSEGMCSFLAVLTLTTPACAVLTLAMIAVNRYMLITKNKKTYQQVYRSPIIITLVVSTWLLPLSLLVIPQLTRLGSIGYDEFYRICKWILDLTKIPIYQTMTSLIFLVSTGVIIFCYLSIYLHVRKHIQGMKAKRQSQVVTMQNQVVSRQSQVISLPSEVVSMQIQAVSMQSISVEAPSTTVSPQHPANNNNRVVNSTPSLKQVKITKNLCYVVIVFFVCVVPYSVLILFQVHHVSVTYIAVIFFLSSNINPMLYAAKHPDFRVVFSCLLHCNYTGIPHPSACLRGAIIKAGAKPSTKSSSGES